MSIILNIATPFIKNIMYMISILFLIQGHNNPGGGFIGGLVASAAIALENFTNTKSSFYLPWFFMGIGLFFLTICEAMSLYHQNPLLSASWLKINFLDMQIKLGTPFLFDVGIYFVVVGSVNLMCHSMYGDVYD